MKCATLRCSLKAQSLCATPTAHPRTRSCFLRWFASQATVHSRVLVVILSRDSLKKHPSRRAARTFCTRDSLANYSYGNAATERIVQ